MRIAMIGTRGVPAAYGGFETAVEEIGQRLVDRGHQVTVYTRPNDRATAPRTYLGMDLVPLPAIKAKAAETISHTGLSTAHVLTRSRPDAAFLFNAANACYIPLLHARRIPVATHVDGLEWKRTKWGNTGQSFYRKSEQLAVRYSDALIADAPGIAQYYQDEFAATTDLIAYGAPIIRSCDQTSLPPGLLPKQFHLMVARFEPENHVLEGVRGYVQSDAQYPLIVVGSAPFADEYIQAVEAAGQADPRVTFLGGVWDQAKLDALYAGALTYIHGHSVGGTNPSLLRAMGAAAATLAYDVNFNRETLGEFGRFFSDSTTLAGLLESAEQAPDDAVAIGRRLQERAEQEFVWDDVADRYEELAERLVSGQTQRGHFSGKRVT